MNKDFSKQIQIILKYSREEALRLKSDFINTEHILLGLLKDEKNSVISLLLSELNCNPVLLKSKIENAVKPLPFTIDMDDMPLTKRAENVLKRAWIEAGTSNSLKIKAEHLFLALLQETDGIAARILNHFKIDYNSTKKILRQLNPDKINGEYNFTPAALHQYGVELTEQIKKNRLDPVIGREQEIARLLQILCRKKKNNPLVIGEPGIGKTALVEGLARRIVSGEVPGMLADSKIFNLDLVSLLSGTALRGQLEEKLKFILKKILRAKNVFLFIDEIHNIVNVSGNGNSLGLANLLKPLLADGRLRVIGTTTLDDYRRIMEQDKALIRRFQNIHVKAPGKKQTVMILNGIKSKYENYHHVAYSNEALQASVTLSDRYLTDRFLPDKAIDLLDEAAALVRFSITETEKDSCKKELQYEENYMSQNQSVANGEQFKYRQKNYALNTVKFKKPENNVPVVRKRDIAKILHLMTGISMESLSISETDKFLNMEKRLNEVVFGHSENINRISNALKRARAGLKDPGKPVGTFLLVGPSGVGKSKLAKELANYLFDNEQAFLQFDMTEYMEKYSISRLIGAPPGYVGYERGGELTEKVRRYPYSIVLFDNIEKAHPDILNILLQILDEGTLTDSIGRKIDFKNTIVILTMHFDKRQKNAIGFNSNSTDFNSGKEFVKKVLTPELVNRLDEVLEFNYLNENNLRSIVKEELKRISNNLAELGYIVKISDKVIDLILMKATDKSDARKIKSVVRKCVEDSLAFALLHNQSSQKRYVFMDELNNEIEFNFSLKENKVLGKPTY